MSTQYLKVIFPEQRDVFLDQASVGFTNDRLKADSGDYDVTLGGSGFVPEKTPIVLVGTSPTRPMIVEFSRAPISPVDAVEAVVPTSAPEPLSRSIGPSPARKTASKKSPVRRVRKVDAKRAVGTRTPKGGLGQKEDLPTERISRPVQKAASRSPSTASDGTSASKSIPRGKPGTAPSLKKAGAQKPSTRKKNA